MILSSFRKENNGTKPTLKAAFINGDVFVGDETLVSLTKIKSKNELIGEVIGLLQSPAKRVIAALLHHHENLANGIAPVVVAAEEVATPTEVSQVTEILAESLPVAETSPDEPAAEAAPEA